MMAALHGIRRAGIRPHGIRPHGIRRVGIRRAGVVIAAATLLAGCASGGSAVSKGPPVTAPLIPVSYVAVGASDTVGVGADDPLSQAWPQVLFHTGFPKSTTFTNLGIPGETVAGAIADELPSALALHPTVVTVWLNVNDLVRRVDPVTYQRQLEQLVHALRAGGRTSVLLANTPPAEQLPAYLACRPDPPPGFRCQLLGRADLPDPAGVAALVGAYNTAIAAVATREGAILVDLHRLGETAQAGSAGPATGAAGSVPGGFAALISADGFHPDTAGHAAIAAAFADALRRADVLPATRPALDHPVVTGPGRNTPAGNNPAAAPGRTTG